ncbi:myoD family inhibitor domain-containing protein 2 [Scleropages formosus]|uniref:myoD family inhibitor domain-containing protein 2 n=1 Tax=Scleropages formosus TaxID=113540 RepID=UPI0010FAC5F6|nr:myoD family inhibitor domain-containing protein 2 [Scleropages formosus]
MAAQNSRENNETSRNTMEGEEQSILIKAGCDKEQRESGGPLPRDTQPVLRQEPARSARIKLGGANADAHPRGGGGGGGGLRGASDRDASTYSLCSMHKYGSSCSSVDRLSAAPQPDAGDDCASIILTCLFCRFYDVLLMLPDTCESAALRCCPTCGLLSAPAEPLHSHDDCNCNLEFDCGLLDACHETGECLELAMEVSEICYR